MILSANVYFIPACIVGRGMIRNQSIPRETNFKIIRIPSVERRKAILVEIDSDALEKRGPTLIAPIPETWLN